MAVPLILRWPNREPAHDALLSQIQPDQIIGAELGPNTVAIERYRYRGARIPTPWSSEPTMGAPAPAA